MAKVCIVRLKGMFSFSQMDVNIFFMQLQEQDDYVAGWSENTVKKIRQILIRVLVENEYGQHQG